MCLYTEQTDAKKAKSPIICYKTARLIVLEPGWPGASMQDPVLRSMYFGFSYRLKTVYKCDTFKTECTNQFVNDGFHSYKKEKQAQYECDTKDEVVLCCRIPKGALYFEGDNHGAYCSDQIEVLGWRYSGDEMQTWHTKGGEIKVIRPEAKQTARKVFDIVSKFFKGLWEELWEEPISY